MQELPGVSCTANIEVKCSKVAVRIQLILCILKEEKVCRLGWMQAAVDTGNSAAGADQQQGILCADDQGSDQIAGEDLQGQHLQHHGAVHV